MKSTKMNAQPKAMRRICHHSSLNFFTAVGVSNPVTVGSGTGVLVPLGLGTTTNSDKHTPKPGTTLVEPSQLAETHWPWRSTLVELEHARQLLDPGPEQLEQVESQD
jgi:hypothetical protein